MTQKTPSSTTDGASDSRAGGQSAAESRLAKLRILDKEVTIACRAGEEGDLKQAAAYIDQSMRDLRSRNTTSSVEKIAIVTAINTADALLKSRARQSEDPAVLQRLSALNLRIAQLLDEPAEAKETPTN